MKFRFLIIAAAISLLFPVKTFAQSKGFAIVIDPVSLQEARAEVDDYAAALEQVQGFKVYVVEDRWGVPDSIRLCLQQLHLQRRAPIVGAVFIGDIPIPMVRDAQFLTSAFKMDQRRPWRESSVPSDRFYDDFGLQFDFLQRDTAETNLFYYSLAAEGEQQLRPSIFTGRIRPTDAGGTSRYEKLRAYLRKAVEAKRHPEPVNTVFIYTGSGSVNESKVAHICEYAAMQEHFPGLQRRGGGISYMDYADRPFIKERLMNEMMRPDLSIGLMHHHGDYDTQYLSHYPKPDDTVSALDYLLHCYRTRLERAERYGQNVDSVRRAIEARDGLPDGWLLQAANDEAKAREKAMTDSMNLTLPDFASWGYKPNCRVAFYDACFNAAFLEEDYIAGEYIFQEGRTIAGIGGSVNVLQDKWPDKLIGLLDGGLMVGQVNRFNVDLETHVIGDPTFVFTRSEGWPDCNALVFDAAPSRLKKVLRTAEQPDVRILALELLRDDASLKDEDLLNVLRNDPAGQVRLEAFEILMDRRSPLAVDAILVASQDKFELLQRFAVNEMSHSGDPRLAPALARLIVANNTSARVAFNAQQAIQFFEPEVISAAVQEAIEEVRPFVVRPDAYAERIHTIVDTYIGRWDDDFKDIISGEASAGMRRSRLGFMKIYLPPYLVPDMVGFAESLTNEDELLKVLDAFGWHGAGYKSDEIRALCGRIIADGSRSEKVRREALKTAKRLK